MCWQNAGCQYYYQNYQKIMLFQENRKNIYFDFGDHGSLLSLFRCWHLSFEQYLYEHFAKKWMILWCTVAKFWFRKLCAIFWNTVYMSMFAEFSFCSCKVFLMALLWYKCYGIWFASLLTIIPLPYQMWYLAVVMS